MEGWTLEVSWIGTITAAALPGTCRVWFSHSLCATQTLNAGCQAGMQVLYPLGHHSGTCYLGNCSYPLAIRDCSTVLCFTHFWDRICSRNSFPERESDITLRDVESQVFAKFVGSSQCPTSKPQHVEKLLKETQALESRCVEKISWSLWFDI